jgi:transcriptional regulator with XRE-family HTH domain
MPDTKSPATSPGVKRSASSAPQRLRTPIDNQRSAFLRRCRSRIKPADVGLVAAEKTRSEGLRREDVAALSGVSATWYTWLEQGRKMRVSDEVLERLCLALRLSEDERTYLFFLVQSRAPQAVDSQHQEAPADIVRMINALSIPAIAMNLRWDVLAWNDLNTAIYRDYGALPPAERNLLESLFLKPVRHMSAAQLEVTAQRLVARLRYDYSRFTNDARMEALIHRLNTQSPMFNRIWRTPDFSIRGFGQYRFTHARFGALNFEHTSCSPDGHPEIRVVICTPTNAAAQRAVSIARAEFTNLSQSTD